MRLSAMPAPPAASLRDVARAVAAAVAGLRHAPRRTPVQRATPAPAVTSRPRVAARLHYSGRRGIRHTHMEDAVRLSNLLPTALRARWSPAPPAPDLASVRAAELGVILGVRAGQDPAAVEPWGLALSGGGIRSATFGLGVLQGLARLGLLRCFH